MGAFVAVAAAIVLGPAGLAWVGSTMAWAIGGALGGAITGALEGGLRGALIGGLTGGILGGIGGWAAGLQSLTGNLILGGMFVGGVANAAANDSWDSFAGGLAGGITGGVAGKGIVGSKQFQNWKYQREVNKVVDQIIAKVKSGEIDSRQLVNYLNEPGTDPTIKGEIGKVLQNAGFKQQADGSYTANVPEGKFSLPYGAKATVEQGTQLNVTLTESTQIYGTFNKPITISAPFIGRDSFSQVTLQFNSQTKQFMALDINFSRSVFRNQAIGKDFSLDNFLRNDK